MAVDRPTKVKIGYAWWKILYSKTSWDKYMPGKHKFNCGYSLPLQHVILLNSDLLDEDAQKETLVHELLHSCLMLTDFENQSVFPTDKNDIEEFMILLTSPILLGVLIENPEVVAWLTHS